ncbi:MAG: Tad domain-containing protein [Candidatus Schekmanbacteria bacterium]|nr:Tad domain-containing protein [Candidatus Schekmanbacteria bacterium]
MPENLHRPLGREHGQAFLMALFLVLGAFLFVGLIYNTGVLISHKEALQNAADVGAMSGAAVHALGFNEIIRKEKEIRRQYFTYLNKSASHWEDPVAVSMPAAIGYAGELQAKVDTLMKDIDGPGGANAMFSFWAKNMVKMIVKKNYVNVDGEPDIILPHGLENKITLLKKQHDSDFYYYYQDVCSFLGVEYPCTNYGSLPKIKTWHDGKDTRTVTVMGVRVRSKPIPPEQLFAGRLIAPDGIPPMEAVAAAKPFGGYLVHDPDRTIIWQFTPNPLVPWGELASLPMGNIVAAHAAMFFTPGSPWPPDIYGPTWNYGIFFDRDDYEEYLVKIGYPRVANALGHGIPDAHQYLH